VNIHAGSGVIRGIPVEEAIERMTGGAGFTAAEVEKTPKHFR